MLPRRSMTGWVIETTGRPVRALRKGAETTLSRAAMVWRK